MFTLVCASSALSTQVSEYICQMPLPSNGLNQIIPFGELDFTHKLEPIYHLEMDLIFGCFFAFMYQYLAFLVDMGSKVDISGHFFILKLPEILYGIE